MIMLNTGIEVMSTADSESGEQRNDKTNKRYGFKQTDQKGIDRLKSMQQGLDDDWI
jgi:hypothetical protein